MGKVVLNIPHSGLIIPDRRDGSVMIEINRRIYDNEKFSRVQSVLKEIYERLK